MEDVSLLCSLVVADMKSTCAPYITRDHFFLKMLQLNGAREILSHHFSLNDGQLAMLANLFGAANLSDYSSDFNAERTETMYQQVMLVADKICKFHLQELAEIKDGRAVLKYNDAYGWRLVVH